MARRGQALLGAAVAGAGAAAAAVAVRRGARALDAAETEFDGQVFGFPPGDVVEVETSDGATIVTETAGTGPVVVLVHGITSSRQDWGPVAGRLVDRKHTVVGIDQRGHGDSTSGRQGCNPARLATDLAEVLTALDLHEVVMAGHSMGGIAVMGLAIDHRPVCELRVDRLVLVATRPSVPRGFASPSSGLIEWAFGRAESDSPILRPIAAKALFGRFGSTSLVAAARASALRAHPRGVASCAAGLTGYDITDRLGSITTPTRCVYGTRDLLTPARANRLIARSLPNATRREIRWAGHLLIWTHATEVAEQIAMRPPSAPATGYGAVER